MDRRLTNKQLAVLVYAREFFRDNDQLPNQLALSRHMGYSQRHSTAASRLLSVLASKGYIEPNEAGGYRFKREAAA